MKNMLIIIICIFLLGCATKAPEEFNVSLHSASQGEEFVQDQNKTMDIISFVIQNNEDFDLDCSVLLSLDNQTNQTSSKGTVGLLAPGEQKQVSLTFEMFYGNTDLKIEPSCSKP
ncbi:hypothetical protein KY349_00445 [Candidatus Woesearchaeota archaeon]|jgi:hypothetical protein|nr:hypothetical protein [Candidatus Woesearchaeota archaeon]